MRALIIETSLIILLTLMVYWFDPEASNQLAYYHNGIAEGEIWRLISATFCHTNFNHLVLNIVGLIVTLALFVDLFKTIKIFPIIIFCSLFIGLCLFIFDTEVIWYVGLSGVLHGLFSFGVAKDIENKDSWGYLLGAGLVIKIIYEQIFGASQSTVHLIAAEVLVNAHLYGAIAGYIFYIFYRYKRYKLEKSD
ncbi:MAG: rhomboid family GlyGly-CTERM serine protease [Psychromonas sp.]|jgi:rhomboid family GlyGly-CTERM serine protease|uniref:rhombosortase n=1 Tax=Psychromonas sp. TaxID=1884585 RepID=UPI0039E5EB83